MDTPTFTFLVPTHREDRPLKRCLDSLDNQLGDNDECIVIGDTLDGPLPGVRSLVYGYGPRYRYIDHNAGRHSFGHDQLNVGLAQAKGEWLHVNDDDDIWTPGSVAVMREAAAEAVDRPILFRFVSYHTNVYWLELGMFQIGAIGGHCLVTPNLPGKVGVWSDRYEGDWDYIESTVNLLGGQDKIIWRPEIVCVARP